jgi:trehalose monomycolate/heme transporter
MPDPGGSEPTTAIPAQRPENTDSDVDDSAEQTRAIPTARASDADTATEKLNTRRGGGTGGNGLSAQDLLRREGRL